MVKEIKVSVFKSAYLTDNPVQMELMDILDVIKNGDRDLNKRLKTVASETDHDKRNELKVKLLPIFLPNGVFSRRADDGLIAMNGIACIDLDDVKNPTAVRDQLKQFQSVLSIFTSPSRTGLKVLVLHDLKDPTRYRDLYYHLGTVLGLIGRNDIVFDTFCASISKACFMSVDKDIYINENAVPYNVPDNLPHVNLPASESRKKKNHQQQSKPNVSVLTDPGKIREQIIKEHELFEDYYSMAKGNRNNNLFILACFFKDSGIPEDYATNYLAAYYRDTANGFTADEIKATVQSAYSS